MWDPASGITLVALSLAFVVTFVAAVLPVVRASSVPRRMKLLVLVGPFMFVFFVVNYPVAAMLPFIPLNIWSAFHNRRRLRDGTL